MQIKLSFILSGLSALALLAGGCSADNSSRPHSVSGTIETDEVRVASRYGGRVEKLLAGEGDSLKAGQVIAELDAAELMTKRDQAAAVLAELEAGHASRRSRPPRTNGKPWWPSLSRRVRMPSALMSSSLKRPTPPSNTTRL